MDVYVPRANIATRAKEKRRVACSGFPDSIDAVLRLGESPAARDWRRSAAKKYKQLISNARKSTIRKRDMRSCISLDNLFATRTTTRRRGGRRLGSRLRCYRAYGIVLSFGASYEYRSIVARCRSRRRARAKAFGSR